MKWFRHDSNAHTDAKLQKVLMKYGADGYALYWYCIELIAGKVDAQNFTFELEHDSEILGYTLKIDTLRVEEIMRYMVSISLFEGIRYHQKGIEYAGIDTSGIEGGIEKSIDSINFDTVSCMKLLSRLDDHTSRNPQIKAIVEKYKAGSILIDTNSEATPKKHGPHNTTLHNTISTSVDIEIKSIPFDDFWQIYPRKTNKPKAEAAWKKIKNKESALEAIKTNIQQRLDLGDWSLDQKEYIPHASTYLNNTRWEDEIIPKIGGSRGASSTTNRPSSEVDKVAAGNTRRSNERKKALSGGRGTSDDAGAVLEEDGGVVRLCVD